MHRWIHKEKARYYQAVLVCDLFGDWTLIASWGGLGAHRGRVRSTGVPSYEDGLARLERIGKRRRSRGYERLAAPETADLLSVALPGAAVLGR